MFCCEHLCRKMKRLSHKHYASLRFLSCWKTTLRGGIKIPFEVLTQTNGGTEDKGPRSTTVIMSLSSQSNCKAILHFVLWKCGNVFTVASCMNSVLKLLLCR